MNKSFVRALFVLFALSSVSVGQESDLDWSREVAWLHEQTDKPSATATLDSLQAELDRQAEELDSLRKSFSKYDKIFGDGEDSEPSCGSDPKTQLLPLVVEATASEPSCGAKSGAEGDTADDFHKIDFYPTYDRGFVIRSVSYTHLTLPTICSV